jgi:hypothetical protein
MMRSLAEPAHDARTTLELCANALRDEALAARLRSVASEIVAAEARYKEQGRKASLFTIAGTGDVAGHVGLEEMSALYKGTLSRLGSGPRRIYDEIKSAPRNGVCPLCGQRVVSTLDHYLPKSRHPTLAVTPVNLVPSCADCNKAKLDRQPTLASEQTLHPYFDEVDDDVWLVAKVEAAAPPALVFYPDSPAGWDDVKRARVSTHFRTFGLGRLYATHAAEELLNIRHSLGLMAGRGGAATLRAHLIEQAESRQAMAKNSWQSAMYKALAESEWFCEEGYKLIA